MFDENSTARSDCDDFMVQEYDHLMQWIELDFPSSTLCTLMGACDYPIDPIDSVCQICEIGFGFLEDIMAFGPTEEMIEWVLNYICYIFPEGSIRDTCETLMDTEFEKIIGYLEAKLPPHEICVLIGGCQA